MPCYVFPSVMLCVYNGYAARGEVIYTVCPTELIQRLNAGEELARLPP